MTAEIAYRCVVVVLGSHLQRKSAVYLSTAPPVIGKGGQFSDQRVLQVSQERHFSVDPVRRHPPSNQAVSMHTIDVSPRPLLLLPSLLHPTPTPKLQPSSSLGEVEDHTEEPYRRPS